MKDNNIDAFVAGFFVGEGCIHVSRKITKKGHVRHIITCAVGNTEIDLLNFMQLNYNGSIRSKKGTTLSKKLFWEWRVDGMKAEKFLLLMIPFLMGRKLLIANYAIELRNRMRGNRLTLDLRGRAIPLSNDEIVARDVIFNKMRSL